MIEDWRVLSECYSEMQWPRCRKSEGTPRCRRCESFLGGKLAEGEAARKLFSPARTRPGAFENRLVFSCDDLPITLHIDASGQSTINFNVEIMTSDLGDFVNAG